MNDKTEITFMQTRLIRLAAKEWHLSIDEIVEMFRKTKVFDYIEKGYGIFHCEGDEVVLEEIGEFLKKKGINVYAGVS